MGEFFKQLITQLSAIWQKLSMQQRIIISSLIGFMLFGLFALVLWSSGGKKSDNSGYKQMFDKLSTSELADITAQLKTSGYKYEIQNDGTAIAVEKSDYYEAKMILAKEELIPSSNKIGWKNIVTDSPFKDKTEKEQIFIRALEGELTQTIEAIDGIEKVRVHIVTADKRPSFTEKEPSKAAIIIQTKRGTTLSKQQVSGIAYLVSSSVEGLEANNISIVDTNGKPYQIPGSSDDSSFMSAKNTEQQYAVQKQLEEKARKILEGFFKYNEYKVNVFVDLDFNKIESTLEKNDPESKVVISETMSETTVKNAPDGDQTNESSTRNYEVNKTVEHIIHETGNIKRLTVSVAVNGLYETDDDGKEQYLPRSAADLANIESLVRNAIGFSDKRGDNISVVNMQFAKTDLGFDDGSSKDKDKSKMTSNIINGIVILVLLIVLILMLKSLSKAIMEAMNPPLPEVEIPNLIEEEEEVAEIPEEVAYSNELLEKVEIMTSNDPSNVARIIIDWLGETSKNKED